VNQWLKPRNGASGGHELQKRPQSTQFLLDRLDLVSGQRGDERLDRGGVAPGQPAARAGERDRLTATVPYVRTVDTARSAARSHAWNRATVSAPSPDSLLTERL